MSFIIKTGRERGKEGPGVTSLNSESSTGSHLPVEQKVACGGCRRVRNAITQDIFSVSLEVSLQSRYLAYVFRQRGNFKDRQKYTIKILVSLASVLRQPSFRWELWRALCSARCVVGV